MLSSNRTGILNNSSIWVLVSCSCRLINSQLVQIRTENIHNDSRIFLDEVFVLWSEIKLELVEDIVWQENNQ